MPVKITKQLTSLCVVMLTCSVLFGCGGKKRPEGLPKLFPLSVKIIQDGRPLPEASVILMSDKPELTRWPSGGVTGADGVVVITTYGFEGAPEGTFKVVVTKEEVTGGAQSQEEAMKAMQGETTLEGEQHFSLVADEYANANTTPLSIDVSSSNKEVVEFDVGEAVRVQRKLPGM